MKIRGLCLSVVLLLLPTTVSFATSSTAPGTASLGAIVDRHADRHGLPRDFARAVVRVESTWNPQLTGAAGEIGLMQIKFETAQYLGYAGSRTALYDPETNITWGMKYLAGAWKLADGDKCGTVLRYQAGHQARTMTGAARAYCDRVQRFMVAES
jgi:soluble lytic murein transglycosylase-like protein